MSAKEILSEQMTEMRNDMQQTQEQVGRIAECLDNVNAILKSGIPTPGGIVTFTDEQYKTLCTSWEHMYNAVKRC